MLDGIVLFVFPTCADHHSCFLCCRLCVSVFTNIPAVLQLYLNDEPLFSYQPETLDGQQTAPLLGQKSDK